MVMIQRKDTRNFVGVLCAIFMLLFTESAFAITRDQVLANARIYANHTWKVQQGNANSQYNTYKVGESKIGVAYNWGGIDTISEFNQKISLGRVAGNIYTTNGVQSSFAGIDCTGFVVRAWAALGDCYQVFQSPPYNYSSCTPVGCKCDPIHIAGKVDWKDVKPGDMVRVPSHARLVAEKPQDNPLVVYEAVPGGVVKRSQYRGNYTPYRYKKIEDVVLKCEDKKVGERKTPVGGVDLNAYCRQRGYDRAYLVGDDAGSWKCQKDQSFWTWTPYNSSRSDISVNFACQEQYPGKNAWAEAKDWGNAFSWACYTKTSQYVWTCKAKIWGVCVAYWPEKRETKKELGGVNLNTFCGKVRWPGNKKVDGTWWPPLMERTKYNYSYAFNHKDAGSWRCVGKSTYEWYSGAKTSGINVTQACREQRSSNAYAEATNWSNPYSWTCYVNKPVYEQRCEAIPITTVSNAQFSVVVTKTGTGSGTVIAKDIHCGADCTGGKYDVGSILDLKAIPDSNSVFAGWRVNGASSSGAVPVKTTEVVLDAVFNQNLPDMKTLYRLYLGIGGDGWSNHMDSGSMNESGFSCQRRLGQLLETQVSGTKPLYRVVRYRDTSGRDIKDDHLATDALSEVVSGSTNEGIMGYVYTTQVPGTIPLYRKYRQYWYTIWGGESLLHSDHITTTDRYEGDSQGWKYERALGYIMGPAASSCP